MKIHKQIKQGTDEWFAVRAGKMTASHADAIGNNGKGLQTYIYNLLAEQYSQADKETFNNSHTDRGVELEPVARSMYELEHDVEVEEVGFIEHSKYVGCSPDGLIGKDGGIEIKCHDDVAHFKMIVNGKSEIASKYIWQIQMNLLVTGRKWWDYVAYNPNFEKDILVFRIEPDKAKHEKLLEGFETGESLIKDIQKRYAKK